MALPNIFTKEVSDELIARINTLSASTQAKWGQMSVDQMLAHCNVTYEMAYENIHPKPNAFMRMILKAFVKGKVTNEVVYKPNNPTAPAFIVKGDRDFEKEKKRLIDYIQLSQEKGEASFENKESLSFGPLSSTEWNNMFYKHLDHHLRQFGV